MPRKVILLRHGEKANAYALCAIGQQRSLALRDTYLGRNATNSVLLGACGFFGRHLAHVGVGCSLRSELGDADQHLCRRAA